MSNSRERSGVMSRLSELYEWMGASRNYRTFPNHLLVVGYGFPVNTVPLFILNSYCVLHLLVVDRFYFSHQLNLQW